LIRATGNNERPQIPFRKFSFESGFQKTPTVSQEVKLLKMSTISMKLRVTGNQRIPFNIAQEVFC